MDADECLAGGSVNRNAEPGVLTLVAAALVGAARAGLPPAASLTPALAEIHVALAGRPPEESLFLLAGAAALYEAAGQLPDRHGDEARRLPAFRPEGDRPPAPPAAARFLERALNQQDTALLPELLGLLDAAGYRAPDALLPHVLEHGAKIARLRPLLLPVVGERGRWLAALNPAWRYAAVDLADPLSLRGAWEADPPGRAALATTIRRADPAAARRLVESTWRAEPETTRRELLGVLTVGLSMDDEPFLERALDDRDAVTRRKAADLLAALPDSRLVGRITAAAGSILVLRDGALSPAFPGEVTDAMARDGIVRAESGGRPSGPRSAADWSRLLIQTVGVISPAHWETRFGLEPEALVAAAMAGKWPRTLITALATAALRRRDGRWIDALLAADGYGERTGMLLAALSPEECHARLEEQVAAGRDESVVVFLRRRGGPWDEASARLLLDFFGRHCEAEPDTRVSATLRFLSRRFAHDCPPSLAGYATQVLTGHAPSKAWQASIKYLLGTLALRREMWEATMADYPRTTAHRPEGTNA